MSSSSVLVLAGGRSRRFGRDKLDLDWRGQALRDHVVARMAEISDDVVVLVSRAGGQADELRPMTGVRYVGDASAWPGPLVAVAAALPGISHDLALVVAADMPVVPIRVLELLAAELEVSDDAPVAGLALDGVIQQLPICVRAKSVSELVGQSVASGERRLGALARLPGALAIAEPVWRALDPTADSLRDIDTAEDLAALLREPADD